MTLLHRLASALRWRIHRDRAERDLNDELESFVEMAAADRMRREVPPAEARRQAVLHLGGVEQAKERIRSVHPGAWLEDLLRDVRYALRMLRQPSTFAAMALLLLALGIGATTVIFTIIHGVLLRPLAYPEPDRLVTLNGVTEAFGELWGASYPDYLDVERESRTLTVAAWRYAGGTVSAPGDPEYVVGRESRQDFSPSWECSRLTDAFFTRTTIARARRGWRSSATVCGNVGLAAVGLPSVSC